ncbi:hypothetical protein ACIZ62_00720 [Acetobacterium carbinolicum]|uniref:hypothetical protein n=1 Tax=Acetobacterium carbinolicum TaxID=52690 RepID=UPI0039BFF82C
MNDRVSSKKLYDVTVLYFYKSKSISINLEVDAESKADAGRIAVDQFLEIPGPEGFRLAGTIVH